jgi:acyl phosphate:glycerol-3-phosphate acyltransferase
MHMDIVKIVIAFISAYLFGAIPFGFIVVKALSGKDVRNEGSGRTGTTNAGRAAGFKAGVITAVLDFLKAGLAVWLAGFLVPNTPWVQAVAGLIAIVGHNYSIHLLERDADGFVSLRGGAGGAPCVGATFALLPFSLLIILPIALINLLVIGYASVATLSISVLALIVFTVRAIMGIGPWEYAGFGLGAVVLLVLALRPNIRRLRSGTERMVGLRVWLKKKKSQQ